MMIHGSAQQCMLMDDDYAIGGCMALLMRHADSTGGDDARGQYGKDSNNHNVHIVSQVGGEHGEGRGHDGHWRRNANWT